MPGKIKLELEIDLKFEYNYPQGRVTDHRINFTLHKIEKIIEGRS